MTLTHPVWSNHTANVHALWVDWWGKTDRTSELAANESVHLPSISHMLPQTKGKLFIRQHYHDLYQRIENQSADITCGGVVITGQPGTGKTYSLFFFLLKKLVDRKPVVFRPASDSAYYFSSSGVQESASVPANSLLGIPASSWGLVNTDRADDSEPPEEMIGRGLVFVVQATSPRPSRYKKWLARCKGRRWCVERWTHDELLLLLKIDPLFPLMQPIDDVVLSNKLGEAIFKWGWAPRDLTRVVCQHEDPGLMLELDEALDGLTPGELADDLSNRDRRNISAHTSHCIICMYRSSAHIDNGNVDDVYDIDFKSAYIFGRVCRTLEMLHWGESKRFISYCRVHRENSALGGWTFEATVLNILCNATHIMDLPKLISATLHGTKFVASTSSAGVVSPFTRTAVRRAIVYFDRKTLDKVTLSNENLYRPSQTNFPLLDAFYLRVGETAATVVVLQMTVSTTHKGSLRGYEFLKELKKHLQSAVPPHSSPPKKRAKETFEIKFEYHLVVPFQSTSPQVFTWQLPGTLPDDIAGRGYVQTVPIDLPAYPDEEDQSSFVLEDD